MGLKFIYTLFVGLLVAAFIGFGIDTFYSGPQSPEYPTILVLEESRPIDKTTETAEEKEARLAYDAAQKTYQEDFKTYNRNVSLIALVAAVLILVVSLVFAGKIAIIADGLLLGGTLTLFYSIIRGMISEQAAYRFIVITIGLIITLVIGYLKFVHPEKKSKA